MKNLLLALAFGAGATPLMAQNLVTNGGFEDGFASWLVGPGPTATWFLHAGGLPYGLPPYEGSRVAGNGCYTVCFDYPGWNTIGQVLATTPGQSYTLAYSVFAVSDAGLIKVYWNGVEVAKSFTGSDIDNPHWTRYTFPAFQATSSSSLFGIVGGDVGGVLFLDGVSVTPVPEPENSLLALAGLGVMALVLRRRKSAAN
jgi:hypothetical protein